MNERPSLRIPLVPDVPDERRNTREAPRTHRTASVSPGYVDVNQDIAVNYDINIGTLVYSIET